MATQTFALLLTKPELELLKRVLVQAAADATDAQQAELEQLADEVTWTLHLADLQDDDPEFSELGRDPRFAPGWWIVPALAVFALVVVFALG